jgi:hypothetical protein
MDDQNGDLRNVPSNTISIMLPVDSSTVNEQLMLVMNVNRPQLSSAGAVTFDGYVSNATEYDLVDVQVNEATLGNVLSTSLLEAGGTAAIEWPADVNETTTYNFVLTAKDKDNNSYTIKAEPITVTVLSVEPTPTNISEGAADVEGYELENKTSSNWPEILKILAIVLAVLIVGVGAVLFVMWKKGKSSGGRPSGSRPSGGSAPRPATPSSPVRKKSSGSYGRSPRKPSGSKGYRDRNNF